ncbi:MAG: heme exporter protein CcmB [Myxococcaceae bacterium]|nr:heme exporter protein CcmB [Myxococcaceae bacterium]MCA3014595.1 heme exporter protein CcmB [Myxococcaceae bacterium]
MTRPSLLGAAWLVLKKDWQIEWRTRARLTALLFFSLATLLLFSFAMGPDVTTLRAHAPGYLWLGLLFASVLSLGESFRVEAENQALTGLVLTPVEPRAIFLGKVLGNASLLFGLSLVLLPVTVALYDVDLGRAPLKLLLVLFLGCLGISAPGTVYSAISANARARDVMLPLLLFPVLVPLLLAAVSATKFTLAPDPQEQLGSWLRLLTAFDLIYLSVGFLLFPKVVEED